LSSSTPSIAAVWISTPERVEELEIPSSNIQPESGHISATPLSVNMNLSRSGRSFDCIDKRIKIERTIMALIVYEECGSRNQDSKLHSLLFDMAVFSTRWHCSHASIAGASTAAS
jgi:hypothetical protein